MLGELVVAGDEASFLIDAVLVGPAAPFGSHGGRSGIVKTPATGPVPVETGGMAGDEQADRRYHGGPEKAVHHYAFDHYAEWKRSLRPACRAVLATPGAFGENLSTSGLTEAEVCVGDIWRAGTALLQVSQARQPCFKLNHRFGLADMAIRVCPSSDDLGHSAVFRSGGSGPSGVRG
ncbi:MOSC domain-containing protein [Methylobacterium sp. WL30]|nr:MOSC domain-containing protein [Methylobacterium sp. WL93]TXN45351.1 MOSC domain-containing protein [Methylobacterium sp. WL119]TXN63515.1 MOSC domain-containing protein [Methylobacterium sp. WL30]